MPQTDIKLLVDPSTQRASLFDGERLVKTYVISTAANGLGCEAGSNKTPYGRMVVAEKFGDGAPLGAVFQSRVQTGAVWTSEILSDDLILTRILWLAGCEADNANTKARYIYIHGTNREDLLGTPASHGCIRMSNRDVIELFDLLPVGAAVEVRAG